MLDLKHVTYVVESLNDSFVPYARKEYDNEEEAIKDYEMRVLIDFGRSAFTRKYARVPFDGRKENE